MEYVIWTNGNAVHCFGGFWSLPSIHMHLKRNLAQAYLASTRHSPRSISRIRMLEVSELVWFPSVLAVETCELQRRRNKSLQSSADKNTVRIVREIEASWIRACTKCKIPYAILLFNVRLFLGPRPSAWLFTSLGSLNVPGKAEFRLRCKRDLDTKIEVALLVFRWMAGHISKVTMTPGSLMWHQLGRFNRPKRTEQRNNYKLGTPRNEIAEFFEWIQSIYCRFLSSLSMFFVWLWQSRLWLKI